MAETLLRKREKDDRAELAEHVHAMLPLAGLAVEKNPITGRMEYVAPSGQAFQIIDKFSLTTDQNDIALWMRPVESVALLKKRYAAKFEVLLEEANGDEETAIRLLYEAEYEYEIEPIMSFTGKRLSVGVTNDSESLTAVVVRGEIASWHESGRSSIELPVNNNGDSATETHYYDVPLAITNWQQEIAEAELATCTILLVDYEPPEAELVVQEESQGSPGLWLPQSVTGLTAQRVVEAKAEVLGLELSTEQEQEWVEELIEEDRARAEYGLAIGYIDDPLRKMVIIKGKAAEDIDALAEQVLHPPPEPEPEESPF